MQWTSSGGVDGKRYLILFCCDAKSFRRKFFLLQKLLHILIDLIFFTGRKLRDVQHLPGQLAVDLSVDLFADPQQRFPISFLRHSQMIGKIVAQAADAPVEHGNVLIVVQKHGALQSLQSLELFPVECRTRQQDGDKQDDCQKCVGKVPDVIMPEVGVGPAIDHIIVTGQQDELPCDIGNEAQKEICQTDPVWDLGKQPVELFPKQIVHCHDGQEEGHP